MPTRAAVDAPGRAWLAQAERQRCTPGRPPPRPARGGRLAWPGSSAWDRQRGTCARGAGRAYSVNWSGRTRACLPACLCVYVCVCVSRPLSVRGQGLSVEGESASAAQLRSDPRQAGQGMAASARFSGLLLHPPWLAGTRLRGVAWRLSCVCVCRRMQSWSEKGGGERERIEPAVRAEEGSTSSVAYM